MAESAPPFDGALHASPILAKGECAERKFPIDSDVKQPRPRSLAAPIASELCEDETL
jgi:hypothetical protein